MSVTNKAIDGYLKLVRIPLDTAVGLLPGNGDGRGPAAGLALDRADATVRAIAATVPGSTALRRDAERRRTAADEREKALRLRAEARNRTQQADAELATREERAERQREQAGPHADAPPGAGEGGGSQRGRRGKEGARRRGRQGGPRKAPGGGGGEGGG